jgi:hypothetical protein
MIQRFKVFNPPYSRIGLRSAEGRRRQDIGAQVRSAMGCRNGWSRRIGRS